MGEIERTFEEISRLETKLHNALVNKTVTLVTTFGTVSGKVLWVQNGEIFLLLKNGRAVSYPFSSIKRIKRGDSEWTE